MRKNLALAVKILVSVALLYLALKKIDLSSVASRFLQMDSRWLVVAFAILVAQLVLASSRWFIIVGRCGIKAPVARIFRLIWIGMFFNQTLPSSIGGDAVRMWLLVRDGSSWSASSYSVLLDRMIGLFALAIVVVGSLSWAFVMVVDPVARIMLTAMGFGTIGGFIVFILLRHARHTSFMRWPLTRHLVQLSTLAGDTIFSIKTGPAVTALSLCIQIMTVVALWCLGHAAHAPFDFLQALIIVPPVVLVSTLPISIAGWGVRESALALAFSYAGLSQADGVLVSLLFGVSMLLLGIIGGLVWLATSHPTPPTGTPLEA